MTHIEIIEAKYERLFITLFDIMTFDRYLILKRMKEDEIKKSSTHTGRME